MSKNYYVEVYELHAQRFSVMAASAAEAIELVQSGEGDALDGCLEYIEVAEQYAGDGMPAGIRSVEEGDPDFGFEALEG